MSIIYRYEDEPNDSTLEVIAESSGLLVIECLAFNRDWLADDGSPHLPPSEQLKLFQALAVHLTVTDHTPDAITRWLMNSFEADYLLVMARQLIAHALTAKGEAGLAPDEDTEKLEVVDGIE